MHASPSDRPLAESRAPLAQVALLFLRLGFTAFGGPAAHIAIMENEVVRRRRWLSPERFLDLLGASNLIPGPSSTELAIFIGYDQAGWPGLLLAGTCFILPAAVMVAALAWAYVRFGSLPQIAAVLYGIKPVVIAIVVQALWRLAPTALKRSVPLVVLGAAACAAFALGVDAILVLVGGGIACTFLRRLAAPGDGSRAPGPPLLVATAAVPTSVASLSLATLFLTFLKIGALVFGSGYVLLVFLRTDLVDRLHWLTEPQLLDAVAIGQVTPGPVFTTATFIGYLVGSRAGAVSAAWGAVLATVGIFLPGFVLVGLVRPLVARVRRSAAASAFLDGVNVSALALMAVVTVQLARAALVDVPTILIALAGALAVIRFRLSTTWLVAGGALLGAAVHAAR